MIKKIIEESKAQIDIEDDGSVFVASTNSESAQKAIDMIRGLTAEVEVGKQYTGTVKRLMDFGAFVEVLPGKEGLVHISQLDTQRVERVEDVVNVGDRLEVKVTGIDSMGRINLSHRAVLDPSSAGEGDGSRGGPPRNGGGGGGYRDRGDRPQGGGFRREGGERRPYEGGRSGGPRDGGFRRDHRPDGPRGEDRRDNPPDRDRSRD
jgi:polyribonucleotide nucleotidyltransferase